MASPVKNGVGFVGDQVQTLPQGNACLPQSPEENVLLKTGLVGLESKTTGLPGANPPNFPHLSPPSQPEVGPL